MENLREILNSFTKEDYENYITSVSKFLNGNDTVLLDLLKQKMEDASNSLEFEKAMICRDKIKELENYLKTNGISYYLTREPGGTPVSEQIRNVILDGKNTSMTDECEALLYASARVQLIKEQKTVEKDPKTGRTNYIQENFESVLAIPYDMPIVGYNNNIVNTLRIWDAKAITEFQLDKFDRGEYQKAIEQENLAKTIVEVLYPNDNHYAGKELRLKQQYFFISASLQELIAKYKRDHDDIKKLHEKVTIQMNDTHPTVSVAELMRLLMDEEGLTWDEAWDVTTKTCAYTNHTIMAEALEKWPIDLFSRLLPRVYQIVEEINRRFVAEIRAKYPNN